MSLLIPRDDPRLRHGDYARYRFVVLRGNPLRCDRSFRNIHDAIRWAQEAAARGQAVVVRDVGVRLRGRVVSEIVWACASSSRQSP